MRGFDCRIAVSLALSLVIVTACSSPDDGKRETTWARPSTVLGRAQQLAQAAGTDEFSAVVTSPTTTAARLAKDGKVTGWSVQDGGKPAEFTIPTYSPVATLPIDKIGIESAQAQSVKSCNGPARVITAVVATGKAVTAIQCGNKKKVQDVLIDGMPQPAIRDRFSTEGITEAAAIASAVAPRGGVLELNLGQTHSLSMVLPNMKLGQKICRYPKITVPVKGAIQPHFAPSACVGRPNPKVHDPYANRVAVDLSTLDADKTRRALAKAARTVGVELKACPTAAVRSVQRGQAQAMVVCERGGETVSATEDII